MKNKLLFHHPYGKLVSEMIYEILEAVNPSQSVKKKCSLDDEILHVGQQEYDLQSFDKVHVIGFGKAVLAMASGITEVLGDRIAGGYLITKHFDEEMQSLLPDTITVTKGNHPVPDVDTFKSSAGLVEYIKSIDENDLVIVLISGGGSALCSAPIPGVTPKEMREMTRQLLACGAEIQEMNAIRKHLDQIKGGGLAELLSPATVTTLILSDVIGSPLDVIASGPTVPDTATFDTVSDIFDRYRLWETAPTSICQIIKTGQKGEVADTPKEGAQCFLKVQNVLVADNVLACQTAVDMAKQNQMSAYLMTTSLNGEAREAGRVLVSLMEQIRKDNTPFQAPVCLVFGGETTVTLQGTGLGGRNQELALGALRELAGLEDVLLVTLATDGEDGPTDAAGAWVTGETFTRVKERGLSLVDAMQNNDAYHFFQELNQIVHTGPSGTNVNDVTLCFVF